MSILHSQETLVESAPPTRLVFHPNSMFSSTISDGASGRALYSVKTKILGVVRTDLVLPGTKEVAAQISRKDVFPDTVAFREPGSEKLYTTKVSKWLSKGESITGLPLPTYVLDSALHGRFKIRMHSEHRLALFASDDTTILAHWDMTPSTRSGSFVLAMSATLDSASRLQILVAFMYLEQKLRNLDESGGKDSRTRASGVQEIPDPNPYAFGSPNLYASPMVGAAFAAFIQPQN
ncbi:unnamed protein product [Mycena citricolor]|uniref:DUF6593 domain-containing protein n=1 Tax=Mycena citricolor TaxID=2018698 RepID=A0AAD2JZ53_9AGAR|nr:unnamed protein product [Mycena citricolor]